MTARLRHIFTLDLRALALYRISTGLLLLLAVVQFFPQAEAFYSDNGVIPRTLLLQFFDRDGAINFYLFGGSTLWVCFLLALTFIAALAFTLGFHTRLATVVLWLLITSQHNRNPICLDGGDVMFRVLLFWAIFLPAGARWSIDARRKHGVPLWPLKIPKLHHAISTLQNGTFFGIGSIAFMIQVAIIYIVTSQTKTGIEWHDHGTAVKLSLLNPAFAKPTAPWILNTLDPFLHFLTRATIWGELLLPLLLFSPWKTHLLRLIAIAGLTGLHLGIDLTLWVGYTSIALFAGLLAFLPPVFFDARRKIPAPRPPSQIIGMRPRWAEFIASFCLLWVIIVNLNTLGYPGSREILAKLPSFPANILRLDQRWTMFSPHPPTHQSYILAQAHLENGQTINLRTREIINPQTPLPPYMDYFDSHRWRKYLENLVKDNFAPLRPAYGHYLATQWNKDRHENHPERLKELTLWHVITPLLHENPKTTWTEILHYNPATPLPTTAPQNLIEKLPR